MPLRSLAIVVVLLLVALWLINRSDAESLVREAHGELAELIGKSGLQSGPAAALNARALENLFAASIEISGAAEGLAAVYAPEDLAATMMRLRALFERIELSFGELTITFVSDTEAQVEFSAVLIAAARAEQAEPVSEARRVTSRLTEVDGEWLFTEIRLALP